MKAITSPDQYADAYLKTMNLAMPRETKRPIGFARDWPEDETVEVVEPPKKTRKKKR